MNTDVSALSQAIVEGLANESDTGLALRTLQTALSCSLVSSLKRVSEEQNRLSELLTRCVDKFTTQLQNLIESDAIPHDELFTYISQIQSKQIAFLELQRKIVQSPTKLFSDDILSPEEKKLLTFLKSFRTPEEKSAFLKAVEDALKPNSTNDFA